MTSNPGPNNPTLTQSYFTQSRNSWGRFSSLLCHRVPCGSEREVSTPRGLSLANLSSSWLFIGQVKHFPCHCFSPDRSCKMPHLKEPRTNKCLERCFWESFVVQTQVSVGPGGTNGIVLIHLISSPWWLPSHTSLQIGEYMNILHCAQCHYQAWRCQNIPPSQNILNQVCSIFHIVSRKWTSSKQPSEMYDVITSLEASFSPTPYLRYTNQAQYSSRVETERTK